MPCLQSNSQLHNKTYLLLTTSFSVKMTPRISPTTTTTHPPHSLYRFKRNSTLHTYATKHFQSNKFRTRTPLKQLHTLPQILLELHKTIKTKRLYDPTNPSIILCDPALEKVLNSKYLSTHQAVTSILKQLTLIHTPEPPTPPQHQLIFLRTPHLPNPQPPSHPLPTTTLSNLLRNISQALHTIKNPESPPKVRLIAYNSLEKFKTLFTSHNQNPFNLSAPTLLKLHSLHNLHNNHPLYSDITTQYAFTQDLDLLLQTPPVSHPSTPLTYHNSYLTLLRYISSKHLWHPHNPSIILTQNDQLGQLFGVNTFHLNQLHHLLQAHTFPVPLTPSTP